jgi:hypothetical protein
LQEGRRREMEVGGKKTEDGSEKAEDAKLRRSAIFLACFI